MRTRTGKLIFWSYLLLYTVALTWPGMLPFNRVRPFVLGLPFSLFWVALWVGGGVLVLWAVDRIEARHRGGS